MLNKERQGGITNAMLAEVSVIPQRIQRIRKKGFNLQKHSKKLNGLDCVYVGRGTRWGILLGL